MSKVRTGEGRRATRAVILAAGRGSRLGTLSADLPKVFVELAGRTLLAHQRCSLDAVGVDDVWIVLGHGRERAMVHPDAEGLEFRSNPEFATTNMVATLFCARDAFDGRADVVIAYGDIVYEPGVVTALLALDAPVGVVVDLGWRDYWAARMEDPLSDAESLRVGSDGRLSEIGRRAVSLDEIEGQYIGLVRIRADHAVRFAGEWDRIVELDRARSDGTAPLGPVLYMTDLLQRLIDDDWDVRPAFVTNGWLEVDTPADLEIDIGRFWDPEGRPLSGDGL
jgi:choline kinase